MEKFVLFGGKLQNHEKQKFTIARNVGSHEPLRKRLRKPWPRNVIRKSEQLEAHIQPNTKAKQGKGKGKGGKKGET
jgi:hypothetical protein